MRLAVNTGGKNHAAAAQRAEGNDHWLAVKMVVNNLMPVKDVDGISFGKPFIGHAQDQRIWLQEARLVGRDKMRVVNGGNPVLTGPPLRICATGTSAHSRSKPFLPCAEQPVIENTSNPIIDTIFSLFIILFSCEGELAIFEIGFLLCRLQTEILTEEDCQSSEKQCFSTTVTRNTS